MEQLLACLIRKKTLEGAPPFSISALNSFTKDAGHRNPRNPRTPNHWFLRLTGKEESLPPRGPGHQPRSRVGEAQPHPPQEALHLIALRRGPRGRRVQPGPCRPPPTGQARSHQPRPRPHPRLGRPHRVRMAGWSRENGGGATAALPSPAPRQLPSAGPEGEAEHSPRQRLVLRRARLRIGPGLGSRCRLLLQARRSFLETLRAPAAPRRALRDWTGLDRPGVGGGGGGEAARAAGGGGRSGQRRRSRVRPRPAETQKAGLRAGRPTGGQTRARPLAPATPPPVASRSLPAKAAEPAPGARC